MGLATLHIECNASFEAAEPVLYRAHRIASDSKDLILTPRRATWIGVQEMPKPSGYTRPLTEYALYGAV